MRGARVGITAVLHTWGSAGYSGSQLLRPVRLLAPLYGSDRSPANGGFYFQAFNGSVVLPVAGYDYNSDWTPLLAGLSPAGIAASLAALVLARRKESPSNDKGPTSTACKASAHVARWQRAY